MINIKPLGAALLVASFAACSASPTDEPIQTLLSQPINENFYADGEAYFSLSKGELTTKPDGGRFKLRTLKSYSDFELSVDFLVDADTNSGIYFRCDTPDNVNPNTCYEVNIFDNNKDVDTRTGSIMRVAPQLQEIPTAGKWSTMTITANGQHIQVTVNGVKTIDIMDSKHASGIMAIQYAEGGKMLRMKNLTVKPL